MSLAIVQRLLRTFFPKSCFTDDMCQYDLGAIERKVIARGLAPFNHADYEPGRRFYFFDEDGIEYEIISYAKQP
jgi:hypothetical protein